MRDPLPQKRLNEMRVAAEVGIRMSGFHPHTVHVNPEELASLCEEVHIRRGEPVAEINTAEMARADLKLAQLREQVRQWTDAVRILSLAANIPPEVQRTLELLNGQMAKALPVVEVAESAEVTS